MHASEPSQRYPPVLPWSVIDQLGTTHIRTLWLAAVHMDAALAVVPELSDEDRRKLHNYFLHTCHFLAVGCWGEGACCAALGVRAGLAGPRCQVASVSAAYCQLCAPHCRPLILPGGPGAAAGHGSAGGSGAAGAAAACELLSAYIAMQAAAPQLVWVPTASCDCSFYDSFRCIDVA